MMKDNVMKSEKEQDKTEAKVVRGKGQKGVMNLSKMLETKKGMSNG